MKVSYKASDTYLGTSFIAAEDETSDPDKEKCETTFFKKIKFKHQEERGIHYNEQYDFQEGEQKILLELEIKQAASKTINVRASTGFLDYLGDVGGFAEAVSIFSFLGSYFSSKLLAAAVAKKLYIRKK